MHNAYEAVHKESRVKAASQVWWGTPAILALRKQKQFEASLEQYVLCPPRLYRRLFYKTETTQGKDFKWEAKQNKAYLPVGAATKSDVRSLSFKNADLWFPALCVVWLELLFAPDSASVWAFWTTAFSGKVIFKFYGVFLLCGCHGDLCIINLNTQRKD